jgi:hypothetical protein
MKSVPVLLIVAFTSFLFSCKKDNSTPNSNSSNLPKSYTQDVRSGGHSNPLLTFYLSYDAGGRLTTNTTKSAPLIDFEYTYPLANTVTLDFYQFSDFLFLSGYYISN